jgi:arylsulfatase A-like enzyme
MLRWCSAILMALLASAAIHAAEERPNFVFIIADDVSAEDLGCYGHPHIRTPNLDRLAKDGLRFERAFLTCSSCSPSRCSIITSRYPHQTGAAELHQPLPAEQVTLAEALHEHGYYVACAGKWHLGNPSKKKFDQIVAGQPSGCEQWVKTLAERPNDQPFLMWFAALDAHREYAAGAIEKPHTEQDAVVPPFLPDVPEVRRDLAMYYDEIARLDGYVGRVLEELERQKVADNTVVMFIADNGRPFPRCKTTVYDSGIRTPCLVRWPAKIKPGGVSQSLISSIDIAPTFLTLAGIDSPKSFVGQSFAALLIDPHQPHRDAIFAEHNWHDYRAYERAVRTDRYLYIRNWVPQAAFTPPADAVRSPSYVKMLELHAADKLRPEQRTCFITPSPEEQLFDLEADPHSLRNLGSDKKLEPVLEDLRRRLGAWRTETGDEMPKVLTPDKYDRTTGKPPQ